MLSKLHVFLFSNSLSQSPFFFHPSSLCRLFSIDEQRQKRQRKRRREDTNSWWVFEYWWWWFFLCVRSFVMFSSFPLSRSSLCVRCVLILFLDFRFLIQRENSTRRHKKNTHFETREREKESRRFASPLQKTTTTTQQHERLRRRFRSFGRGEIFLSKRVVNRVHTRARF